METFVWDENFRTDIQQVDEQHHGLVDLFNELSDALFLSSSDHARVLEDTFVRLVEYTNKHFRDEERLMHDTGLDPRHVEQHQSAHAAFVRQVHAMWTRREEMSNAGESIIGFLTSWLALHILGMDQSMARQIASVKRGVEPAQAYDEEHNRQGNDMQALLKMVSNLYHVLTLQNEELVAANMQLEERVAQRTLDLARANAELRKANLVLETHSRTDGLLQIANRGYFDERLEQARATCRRRQTPLGLLLIDVDFFKRYNDTYGHQAGDAALQAIARTVKATVKRSVDLVARYGGEELAVLLPETDSAGVAFVAERIVEAVARLNLPHERSDAAPHVTVSVGATSAIPTGDNDAQALLLAADEALYQAKDGGRNRAVVRVEPEPALTAPLRPAP